MYSDHDTLLEGVQQRNYRIVCSKTQTSEVVHMEGGNGVDKSRLTRVTLETKYTKGSGRVSPAGAFGSDEDMPRMMRTPPKPPSPLRKRRHSISLGTPSRDEAQEERYRRCPTESVFHTHPNSVERKASLLQKEIADAPCADVVPGRQIWRNCRHFPTKAVTDEGGVTFKCSRTICQTLSTSRSYPHELASKADPPRDPMKTLRERAATISDLSECDELGDWGWYADPSANGVEHAAQELQKRLHRLNLHNNGQHCNCGTSVSGGCISEKQVDHRHRRKSPVLVVNTSKEVLENQSEPVHEVTSPCRGECFYDETCGPSRTFDVDEVQECLCECQSSPFVRRLALDCMECPNQPVEARLYVKEVRAGYTAPYSPDGRSGKRSHQSLFGTSGAYYSSPWCSEYLLVLRVGETTLRKWRDQDEILEFVERKLSQHPNQFNASLAQWRRCVDTCANLSSDKCYLSPAERLEKQRLELAKFLSEMMREVRSPAILIHLMEDEPEDW